MSVVDTWDWSKVKPTEEKECKITADEKVRTLLYGFEREYGVRPNRINMGWKLADELANQFYYMRVSVMSMAKEDRDKLWAEYEGIPVKIDYDNPNTLEVGYMFKWIEPKR